VRFLADESCDFIVVTALRAVGHDVSAIVEINPGAEDEAVLALARSESRVLLTEDKDFGLLTYAGGQETAGVLPIRFLQAFDARSVKRSSTPFTNSVIESPEHSLSRSQDALASRDRTARGESRLTND
jgi:predicted nuclease of predicted toxin-antitoxin system